MANVDASSFIDVYSIHVLKKSERYDLLGRKYDVAKKKETLIFYLLSKTYALYI